MQESYAQLTVVLPHHFLYVTAQSMLGKRRLGFGRHIEGLETAEAIPLGSHTYSSREASGLLQRYEKLMDLSILMPQKWKGKPVASNLDVRHVLESTVEYDFGDGRLQRRWPISVFLLPDMEDAPFLNYALANYVLSKIFWLKHLNTKDHVRIPVNVCIPEASKAVPYKIREDNKAYFMQPLKSTVIKLAQQAPGMGIVLAVDAQRAPSTWILHSGILTLTCSSSTWEKMPRKSSRSS